MVPPSGNCETGSSRGAWRLAVWGDRQAVWNQVLLGDSVDASGSSRCRIWLREGFYTTLDGCLEAMICWGPSYEWSLYWD